MYPFHSGDQHLVPQPWAPVCSARFHRLLSEKLRDVGYRTHAFGKWHLGYCNWTCTPLYRGFDSFSGFHNGMLEHYNLTSFGRLDWYDDYILNRVDIGTHSTDLLTDRVLARIDGHDAGRPAFFYVNYAAPHPPVEVHGRHTAHYAENLPEIRRKYLGLMSSVDESMMQIIEKLKQRRMWSNTVLIFLSDNGGEFVGIPNSGSNAPLRGGKASLYEGGFRTPAFIHAPHLKHKGRTTNGMFHITDWHSTILSLAGIEDEDPLDGVDQTGMLFEGQPSLRTEIVYNIDLEEPPILGRTAIRQGDYKMILGYPGPIDGWEQDETLGFSYISNFLIPDLAPVRDPRPASDPLGRMDYTWSIDAEAKANYMERTQNNVMLFNLKDDPEERYNVAGEKPEMVIEMRRRLSQLAQEYVAPDPRIGERDPASGHLEDRDAWQPGWCSQPQT